MSPLGKLYPTPFQTTTFLPIVSLIFDSRESERDCYKILNNCFILYLLFQDLYDCIENDNNGDIVLKQETNKRCTKRTSFKKSTTSGTTITRRVTLPRRHKSCSSDDENPVFYINDACDIEEELQERNPAVCKYRRNVQSLPQICSSVRGKNFVVSQISCSTGVN